MNININKSKEEFEISEKRFYLTGIKIEAICPNCGEKIVRDLGDDYLSYPTVNKPINIGMYCCECDGEFSFKGELELNLKVVENKLIEDK